MVIDEAMLCNRFLVAPQFCINSLELAELGELNYFLAGIGSYEAAFFLSTVVVQQFFSATNNLCNWSNRCLSVTKVFWEKALLPKNWGSTGLYVVTSPVSLVLVKQRH